MLSQKDWSAFIVCAVRGARVSAAKRRPRKSFVTSVSFVFTPP